MPSRIIHLYEEGIATPCPEPCLFYSTVTIVCLSVLMNLNDRFVQVKFAVSATPMTRALGSIMLAFLATNAIIIKSRLATKITIPAVKITGDSADVAVSLENAIVAEDDYLSMVPEPAASTVMDGNDWTQLDDLFPVTLDSIDSSSCPVKSTVDALEDPDLGDFLLDAVGWL